MEKQTRGSVVLYQVLVHQLYTTDDDEVCCVVTQSVHERRDGEA